MTDTAPREPMEILTDIIALAYELTGYPYGDLYAVEGLTDAALDAQIAHMKAIPFDDLRNYPITEADRASAVAFLQFLRALPASWRDWR